MTARFLAEINERRARLERHIASNIAICPPGGGLFSAGPELPYASLDIAIHPSARDPGRWQATLFDGLVPVGHYIFASRDDAIRSVSGAFCDGPPIGSSSHKFSQPLC